MQYQLDDEFLKFIKTPVKPTQQPASTSRW